MKSYTDFAREILERRANMPNYEAYQIVIPLLDAMTRISIFSKEDVDKAVKLCKTFCGTDRNAEACLTQFIEHARRLDKE